LTIEVSGVHFRDIEAFQQCVAKAGLKTGGTGAKVRPVVSCKGTTCQYGLYDTYALSEKIHERFMEGFQDVVLPHKFKIAVGGCPNNCTKANLNDVGIVGQRVPEYQTELCRGCKKCAIEAICPVGAAKVVDGKIKVEQELCNRCGRCIGNCYFHCNENGLSGWKISIGGRWGKKISHGRALEHLFTTEEEVMDMVEKVILFFKKYGQPRERLAETIERIGFEQTEQILFSDELV
jgi:dissimilatory sulfite reductase (desulfoviridin) alpha/beta subunit